MSFDEMGSLLNAENEKTRRGFERDRMQWFYTLVAPGFSKAKEPRDVTTFDWEKPAKKESKKLNKNEFKDMAGKAGNIVKMHEK